MSICCINGTKRTTWRRCVIPTTCWYVIFWTALSLRHICRGSVLLTLVRVWTAGYSALHCTSRCAFHSVRQFGETRTLLASGAAWTQAGKHHPSTKSGWGFSFGTAFWWRDQPCFRFAERYGDLVPSFTGSKRTLLRVEGAVAWGWNCLFACWVQRRVGWKITRSTTGWRTSSGGD